MAKVEVKRNIKLALSEREAIALKDLIDAHVTGPDNGPRGLLSDIWCRMCKDRRWPQHLQPVAIDINSLANNGRFIHYKADPSLQPERFDKVPEPKPIPKPCAGKKVFVDGVEYTLS